MTPAEFLSRFGTIADAPNGIPKLRELILQLAVQGRLVPQDPGEGAACVPANPTVDEPPFDIPQSWRWVLVQDIAELKLGRQRSPKDHSGPHMRPYLRVANVFENRIDVADVKQMNFDPREFETFQLRHGDILLNEGQSQELVGRAAIYRGEVPGACFQNTLIRCRVSDATTREYALVVFRSYLHGGRFQQAAQRTTNIAHLSVWRLAAIEYPLPPLPEQHRIVAKVDELMALCDELEARQHRRRTTRRALTASSLAALANAPDADTLAKAWPRVRDNLDLLVDEPESVPTLRRSVLQLAVQGRLVSDVKDDRSNRALIDRIREAGRWVTDVSLPFEPPPHWVGCRFGDLLESVFTGPFGTSLKASEYVTGGVPVVNPQNLRSGRIVPTPETCVGPRTLQRLASFKLRRNDVVVARRGEMGRCAVVREPEDGWLCGTGSLVLRLPPELAPEFVALFIRSPWTAGRLAGESVGSTMDNLNQRIMLGLPFGFPPLPEQHRIVAKVDELMALCDQLEARLTRARATSEALASSATHHLVTPRELPAGNRLGR